MKKFKEWLLINTAVPLLTFVIRLIGLTWKFPELSKTGAEPRSGKTEQYIYGFMHCHLIQTIFTYRGRKIVSLASSHKDGEIAARAASAFGIKMARGSTTRGGAKGLMEILSYMEKGYDAALTVDGPRGPRGDVKAGVLYLSKVTGRKVVLVGFACDKKIKLRSWDKMEIPLFFSSGGFVFGQPFAVPSDINDDDFEKIRQEKIKELAQLNAKAEELVNGN